MSEMAAMRSDEMAAIDTGLMVQIAITVFGVLLGHNVVAAAVVGFVAYWPTMFATLYVLCRK